MTSGSRRSHLTVVSGGRLHAAPRSGSVALSSRARITWLVRVDCQKLVVFDVDVSEVKNSRELALPNVYQP